MDGFTVEYEVPPMVNALVDSIEVECLEDGSANVSLRGVFGATDPDHALRIAAAVALAAARAIRVEAIYN
jgi:hypothetical protein